MFEGMAHDRNLNWAVCPALVAVVLMAVGMVIAAAPADGAKAKKAKPNIVLIQADDAVVSDVRYMPNVRRLLERGGTSFSNYFVSYSLCCTARTTLLTGQFSHNHRVLSNFRSNEGGYYTFRDLPGKLSQKNSLAPWLKRAGYRTALVGKYLNEYGALNRNEVPPGWNRWVGLLDNSTYDYFNYALNIDGNDVAELRVHRQPGFVRRVVAASGVARVKVTVSTDNDGQRHTCFRLAPRRKP